MHDSDLYVRVPFLTRALGLKSWPTMCLIIKFFNYINNIFIDKIARQYGTFNLVNKILTYRSKLNQSLHFNSGSNPNPSSNQMHFAYTQNSCISRYIPLLARRTRPKGRPSATVGYLVYKRNSWGTTGRAQNRALVRATQILNYAHTSL